MPAVPISSRGSALPASGRSDTFTLPGSMPPPHLLGIRCGDCETIDFPPSRFCSRCSSRSVQQVALSRRGVLHSWSTVYQDPGPSFVGEKPFTIVTAELPEGIRVVSTLVSQVPPEQLHQGLEVEVEVQEIARDGDGNPLYDFRFRLV